MSIFLNHPCEKCNASTHNEPNEFAEYICDDCEQNDQEHAWERHCTDYEGPLPLIEQQRQALKFK